MENINLENKKELIIGRNSVKEALKSGRNIDHLLISKGKHFGSILPIISKARELKIPIKEVDIKKLDSICGNSKHQGIIAIVAAYQYSCIDDILKCAEEKSEPPFIIIADCIEDPHNLGAIIRSAECAGAHGIIIQNRRCVGLNYTVSKASAGALEYMKVARVTNISNSIDELKKKGIFIYGADINGQAWCRTDLKGPIALVIGSEGLGLSRLVKEKCDDILSLPLCGNINSLNASVAGGILMYEVCRQRLNMSSIN